MSGFLKTVSNLGQNVFAYLPAIAIAIAVLEKPGGLPSKRIGAESTGAWLPACTKGGPQALSPGGGEGHREGLFAQ